VDFFICSHPAANCELFLPFNKSILGEWAPSAASVESVLDPYIA
jgi:hypothetical protein